MSEDRKSSSSKRFAVLSKESVKVSGEATGHYGLSDDVAALLAEDVVYRLREVTQNSCQFMRHAGRKKLTSEDFNKSLRNSDIPPIFGYGSTDAMTFRQTKEGEVSFVEDGDVNLANIALGTHHVPHQSGKATFKAQWLAVEGMSKSQGLAGKTNKSLRNLTDQQRQYLDNITKAILGSETELTKLALNDLRTNHNISPFLPYLLNFISCGVKSSSHDIPQLNKFLQSVRALVNNPLLFLQPKPYLDLLIESVTLCVIDPLSSSINQHSDHWALREFAARLLVQIIRSWEKSGLEQESLDRLQEVLYDLERPLCSHYGAIIALGTFGTQAVEEILRPHLPSYMHHLETLMEDKHNTGQKQDATKVYGAIRLCCEYVIRARNDALLKAPPRNQSPSQTPPPHPHQIKQETTQPTVKSEPTVKTEPQMETTTGMVTGKEELIGTVLQLPESTNPYKIASELYTEMSSYFGDSLSGKLPINRVTGFYSSLKKEDKLVQLSNEDAKKSGDELLQQIMNAPLPPQHHHHHHHSRGPSRMHSMANTEDSDLHSFFDDEKSELSDDQPFLLDDADLTVRTTVNDPSLGIKLTITKRPKTKSESIAESASKRRKLNPNRLDDIFPGRQRMKTDKPIKFRIRGSESTRKKARHDSTKPQTESNFFTISSSLPLYGRSMSMKLSARNRMQRVHQCAASLDTVL